MPSNVEGHRVVPRTPSIGSFSVSLKSAPSLSEVDATTPSPEFGRRRAFSTDSDGDVVAPPHPFLAYARRVHSFASPLKLEKSQYLLTFVDAETAQEWWRLVQREYPDSVRESAQLFSFKSDKVLAQAWDNPKFGPLRHKWTYRQLEEDRGVPERHPHALSGQGKRTGPGRLVSNSTLRTIGEGAAPAQAKAAATHDPFLDAVSPAPKEFNFVELNFTLNRMQMMMDQTISRIDALVEKQQANAEALYAFQESLEENSARLHALAEPVETNAQHKLARVLPTVEETASRVVVLAEAHHTSVKALRKMQNAIDHTSEQLGGMLQHQHMNNDQLKSISTVLDQSIRSPTSVPNAASFLKVQATVDRNASQLQLLADGQKIGNKSIQKTHSAVKQSAETHDRLAETVRRLQEQNEANFTRLAKKQNAGFDRIQLAMEQAQALSLEQHASHAKTKAKCDHEIFPPPRKMNRKIIGYVYA